MLIVRSEADFNQCVAFIQQSEVLAYDVETTGLNVRKDSVIGIGVSNALEGFYIPIKAWNAEIAELTNVLQHPTLLNSALQLLSTKKLIMHNASFDGRITANDLGVDLVPSLYCDTMLLKHTCDEEFPFGLKEIATKLWGANVADEKAAMLSSIKAAGGSPKEYFKAATDLLATYCVQDCILTFKLYNHYSKELKRQGLERFFYDEEVMPLYKSFVIPMEVNGVTLDMPLLQISAMEIASDITIVSCRIQVAIAPHLELFEKWLLNKDYKLTTPKGKVPNWAKKHATQLEAWTHDNPGAFMFNLESKHHLKKLFFDTLGETALSYTDLGSPQVDDEFLELMCTKYEWCKNLRTFNKLRKIEATYVRKLLDAAENGKFYPSFNMHRTTSGRLSGDLQQLPRPLKTGDPLVVKHNNRIRAFIIASPGCKLLSADYVSLEPTIFAHTSGDVKLQNIFTSGKDFYSEIAIRTLRLDTVSSFKKASNYLATIMPEVRQSAKVYALGVPYGLTGYKLQFELNIPQEEAEILVQNYLSAFPDLARFMTQSQDEAIYNGFVKTETGRIRHLKLAQILFNKYGARLRDSLHLWHEYNKTPELYKIAKADRKTFINLCNNAINHKVQGLAASIMNRASILINKRLKAANLQAKAVLQLHDQLVFDTPEHELATVTHIVKESMENIMKLTVPLLTEPIAAYSFAACK